MLDRAVVSGAAQLLTACQFKPWFYGDSVGLEGLLAASEVLGDPFFSGFVLGLGRGVFARDSQWRENDNTVPGRALTQVAVARGDSEMLVSLATLAARLNQRPQLRHVPVSMARAGLVAPYSGERLSPLETSLLADPGPVVYVDCMHFDAPFLSELGRALEDDHLVDEAARIALAYCALLQQSRGLFDHFYLERSARSYVPAWSRGQGWALLGLVDTLESIGSEHPASGQLLVALQELVAGMARLQLPDGHWRAVADDDQSPVETSTAAFFGAGVFKAIRLGQLDPAFRDLADRASQATIASVDRGGQLRNVSAVVWSSTRSSHYAHVSVDHLVPWGQGPLLLLCAELARAHRLRWTPEEELA